MWKLQAETISREKLDFIYRLKTSALIEASMMVGAVLAGASEAEVKVIEESRKRYRAGISDPG